MNAPINATEGMLYHIIKKIRPELAKQIQKSNRLESIVIGLGKQGTKHTELMREYGSAIIGGVAPGKGGSRIYETIPVYNNVKSCIKDNPNIVAASIWRHYSTAREEAIETIEAGIPLVVLITEGIPLRDIRDILVAVRRHKTLFIGGNTPGLIFPPERIKIGMLPDVFYPEEKTPEIFGSKGVTIISRSGAILYHVSDAMASVGIAQNAVIGVGGDGAIGSTFQDLVPLAMAYKNTDLVIVAGEIGGCQEECLAQDMKDHPEKYPKPLVALISGARAPEGKTMGHAGAIISPGTETGTHISKMKALESAGVPVVNSQFDLIRAVQKKLNGKTYFEPTRYYHRMKQIWEAPPPKPSWITSITDIKPNYISIRGHLIQDMIHNLSLIEAIHLIVQGNLPDEKTKTTLNGLALEASQKLLPKRSIPGDENISKSLVTYLLMDSDILKINTIRKTEKTVYCLGRITAYLAHILGNDKALFTMKSNHSFSQSISASISGINKKSKILEAMIVASLDHGVTPPSAQATLIASSVRVSYEMAVAQGIGAITDVHGGAGQNAAQFFHKCVALSKRNSISLPEATRSVIIDYIKSGYRIEGLGHRIHHRDPRRDILWKLADAEKIAGPCVEVSKMVTDIFKSVKGITLPINVDGVIGAIVADMSLDPKIAKALFIFGRIAGLSAHYFEEIATQPPMRQIHFEEAVYKNNI